MKKMSLLLSVLFLLGTGVAKAQIINTIAGDSTMSYSGDGGQATDAELNYPWDVVVDGSGNIYISDASNNRIRKVNGVSGIISTIAGNGTPGFNADGIQATASEMNSPAGITLYKNTTLYIADRANERIRVVNLSTGIINTIAGNGTAGYYGDGSAASLAELFEPNAVATDTSGNVYVADFYNNVVRKVFISTGLIGTVAGNGYDAGLLAGGYSGDGSFATLAELYKPCGVAVDESGNIFISDCYNSVIREVNASSTVISTIAGNNAYGGGYSGDGGPATLAELYFACGIRLDNSGDLFIADSYNGRIRKLNLSSGIINTVAGTTTQGYSGDGGFATAAELAQPEGVFADASGAIYLADTYNGRMRKFNSPLGIDELRDESGEVQVYPNPTTGIFTIQSSVVSSQWSVEVYTVMGEKVYSATPSLLPQSGGGASFSYNLNISDEPSGVYLYRVIAEDGSLVGEGKLVVEK
jgi:trimeric autotransporter adhesin